MNCADCGHHAHDHMDRALTGAHCAPPAQGSASTYATRRCDCPGWRPASPFQAEMALLRETQPVRAWVRSTFAAAFPWLDLSGEGSA